MKKFNSICIITNDVPGLRDFYQTILDIAPEGDDAFVTFSMPGAKLSLFSAPGLEEMVPGLMDAPGTGRCFLEFEVEDVDEENERLKTLNVMVVKPPTTQPWGVRSVWFRDSDGNLVNFYAHAG